LLANGLLNNCLKWYTGCLLMNSCMNECRAEANGGGLFVNGNGNTLTIISSHQLLW